VLTSSLSRRWRFISLFPPKSLVNSSRILAPPVKVRHFQKLVREGGATQEATPARLPSTDFIRFRRFPVGAGEMTREDSLEGSLVQTESF